MIVGLLWFVFVVACLLLGLIILLQEGKGGGLAEAFGGMGAETFGVKAAGVNKATAILAAVFILSAILINRCSVQSVDLGDAPAPVAPADTPADTPAQETGG